MTDCFPCSIHIEIIPNNKNLKTMPGCISIQNINSVTLLAQQIAGGSKRMIVQIFFDDLICKVIIWWRSFAHLKLYFCKVTITKDVAETTSLLYITNSRGGFLGNTLCPLLSEASFNTWGLGVVFFWKFKIKI